MTALAGYTARVSELLEQVKVLDEVGVKPFEIIDGLAGGQDSSEVPSFPHTLFILLLCDLMNFSLGLRVEQRVI